MKLKHYKADQYVLFCFFALSHIHGKHEQMYFAFGLKSFCIELY